MTLLYLLVPPFKGNGRMMPLLSMSSAVAIVVGTRMHGPGATRAWQLMALGQFLFACGDVYTYSYPALPQPEVPFPSIGDGIYLALYPALFGGILLIARRRNPSGDRATLIDSLILTIGLGVISWAVLISPYVHDTRRGWWRGWSRSRTRRDILLLAGALRLAVTRDAASPASTCWSRPSSRCWRPTSSTACSSCAAPTTASGGWTQAGSRYYLCGARPRCIRRCALWRSRRPNAR